MNKSYAPPSIGNVFTSRRTTAPKPRPIASVPTPAPRDPSPTASVTVTLGLFSVIGIMGWVYLGIIAAAAVLAAMVQMIQGHPLIAVLMLPAAFILALPGLLTIAFAQTSRSVVDTAENTRRLVELLESRINAQTNV